MSPRPLHRRKARPPPAPRCFPHTTAFPRSFGEEPPEENRVHLGHAIMSFYAALIDLLGRCAPEMHVSPKRPGTGRGIHGHPRTSSFRHDNTD